MTESEQLTMANLFTCSARFYTPNVFGTNNNFYHHSFIPRTSRDLRRINQDILLKLGQKVSTSPSWGLEYSTRSRSRKSRSSSPTKPREKRGNNFSPNYYWSFSVFFFFVAGQKNNAQYQKHGSLRFVIIMHILHGDVNIKDPIILLHCIIQHTQSSQPGSD